MSEKSIKREAEGYFCILSYAGDGLYLMPSKMEKPMTWEETREFDKEVGIRGLRIDDLLDDCRGKKVKVTVELVEEEENKEKREEKTMMTEEELKERLADLNGRIDNNTDEWTKEHLCIRKSEVERTLK